MKSSNLILVAVGMCGFFAAPLARHAWHGWTSIAAAADAGPINTLTEEEKSAGWKLIFDGKTTDGWRNYKKDTVSNGWKVLDGSLTRNEKGAGDIITKDKYDSFELSLEYNISRAGNSGIMYHVTEEGGTPWQTGPEIQVQDNKDGHDPQRPAGCISCTPRIRMPQSRPASGTSCGSSSRRRSASIT